MNNKTTHLFYVASSIVHLVALKYIESEKIDTKNVVFILNRHFWHEYYDDKIIIEISDLATKYDIQHIFYNLKSRRKIQRMMDKHIPGPYHLYIPQFKIDYVNLFSNPEKCQSITILEEGILALRTWQNLTTFKRSSTDMIKWRLKMLFATLGQESPKPFIIHDHPRLKRLVGVSEYSFKDFENRLILTDTFKLPQRIEDRVVYVFSDMHFHKKTSKEQETYLHKILSILSFIAEKYEKVIDIKYHPSFYTNTDLKDRLASAFEKHNLQDKIKEMDVGFALEQLAANSNSIFIGTHSSVLFYALLQNCRVISDYYLFFEEDKLWHQFPKALTSQFEFLDSSQITEVG